jgi:hypothetical protein
VDVFLFSPSIHNSAYFLNVFEHGDDEHPGLSRVAALLFGRIDPAVKIGELVSDSRNTVYSNYFIAKPRFWRAWLAINEQLFAIAEAPEDPLGAELRAPTVPGPLRRANEDIHHGAGGHLDPGAIRASPRARAIRSRRAREFTNYPWPSCATR